MAVRQIGHRKSSLVLSGRFPSPNDVPVLLLNQPNIALGGVRFWIASDPQVIKHQHLTFSVAVRSSLAHILRQVQWWSVAIVTRYDVISSRWSSQFWLKIHFFSTSFNNKSNSCDKNHAKCLFMCYFSCKHKKLPFLLVLTWFLILGKLPRWRPRRRSLLVTSQASSSATTHKIYLILLRKSKAFHLR